MNGHAGSGKAPAKMQSLWQRLGQPLRFMNRYALLQPNFFGFGLNLNAVLEDGKGP